MLQLNIGADNRTVFRCNYHIANATRFKKPYFNSEDSLIQVENAFMEAAGRLGVRVHNVVVKSSLISMKMEIDPSQSPASVFAKIKFAASKMMKDNIPDLPNMVFAKTFMVTTCGQNEDGMDILEYIDDVKSNYNDKRGSLN